MTAKKIPVRKCMGCMEAKPKKELVRVVRPPEGGAVTVDATGKLNGRGAYLCPSRECLAKARKARRLERALECDITDEVWSQLEAKIEERRPEDGKE